MCILPTEVSLCHIVNSNTAGILLLRRYQGCGQKQQQPISPTPPPPSPPPPPSSAFTSAWLIRTLWCFFKNPCKDLYSRWGPGRFFLNIYEPLDRGSGVLDCCPRCPLASESASSSLKSTLCLSAAIRHTGNRGFKCPLGSHSLELWQLHCKVVGNLQRENCSVENKPEKWCLSEVWEDTGTYRA